MTSRWTMASRTIVTSNGVSVPRWIVRTTVVPFLPRTLSRASSTVRPSSPEPSTWRIDVAGQQPGLLRPASPRAARRRSRMHSGPSVAQSLVSPAADRVPISAPIPSNWPEMSCSAGLVFLGREVRGVRILERLDHAPDRALDERFLVDVAAGVAVLDRVVGVPEGLERVGLGSPACPAARRSAGRPSTPGHEQRPAGEDRDDAQGDAPASTQARRAADRRCHGRARRGLEVGVGDRPGRSSGAGRDSEPRTDAAGSFAGSVGSIGEDESPLDG